MKYLKCLILATKKEKASWNIRFPWNSIVGADYYEVQLAMEEIDSFLEIFIFDEPGKIVMKKEGLTETSLDVSEYTDYNSEVYFRVKGIFR